MRSLPENHKRAGRGINSFSRDPKGSATRRMERAGVQNRAPFGSRLNMESAGRPSSCIARANRTTIR